MASIKTPDQRLRVFVSSTLQELAEERKVAREAINKLRLIPVLFELGARPHPPKDLYRAYLDQSHIFVGIYWNSYGWVAPDMEISGLEDEFRLSGGKSRLVYIKNSDERQPKLTALLDDIQKSDSVTFQKFSTPEEFRELLENDLALLLSERFETSTEVAEETTKEKKVRNVLPFIRSELIGREKEMQQLHDLILDDDVGLVTITGAGGTGKSRLAVELAQDVKEGFPEGVFFIALASLADAHHVTATIAHALGLLDTGQQPIQETLIEYLLDKRILLILDNFEHVIDAGAIVSELLSRCHQIKIIVTSRTPLRIRDENIFALSPLAVPEGNEKSTEVKEVPCVKLFVERAREVNPSFQMNDETLQTVSKICRKLDGLPLAIELAAARSKLLSPAALLTRMDKSLDILSQGPRDLPQRHQTIRATIEWSYTLLDDTARYFFRHLAVFSDGWTLATSDVVINRSGAYIDVLDYTDKLLNVGLIYRVESTEASTTDPRFNMLQTVREYALENLKQKSEFDQASLDHAYSFMDLLDQKQGELWNEDPLPGIEWIDADYQNIRVAFQYFIEKGDLDKAWDFIGSLTQFWTSRGRFSEAFQWMEQAHVTYNANLDETEITLEHQARAILSGGILNFLSGHFQEAILLLNRSYEIAEKIGADAIRARAKTYLGAAGISSGQYDAVTHLKEAIELGNRVNDEFSFVMSSAFLGEIHAGMGDYEVSRQLLADAEAHSRKSPQKVLLAVTLLQKASYFLMQDAYQLSLDACEESVQVFDKSGFKSMKGWAHNVLAQGYLMTTQLEKAKIFFAEGISSGREAGDKSMVLFGLIGFSSVAFAEKDFQKSAALLGAAEAMIRATGYAFWSTDKKLYQWLVEEIAKHPQAELLATHRTAGEKLSPEKAIALALGQ